jgi:hypothetical protein
LGFDDYANMVQLIGREIKHWASMAYVPELAVMCYAQDCLNEYIDKVDLWPLPGDLSGILDFIENNWRFCAEDYQELVKGGEKEKFANEAWQPPEPLDEEYFE